MPPQIVLSCKQCHIPLSYTHTQRFACACMAWPHLVTQFPACWGLLSPGGVWSPLSDQDARAMEMIHLGVEVHESIITTPN